MKEKIYKIVLFGPPGSGKDTQAAAINEKLNIPVISTGELFREAIKKQTEIGRKAKKYYDLGVLIPDELTNALLYDRLLENDCQKGFVLSGYPRNLTQAEDLTRQYEPTHALEIWISNEEVVTRIVDRRTCLKCDIVYHTRFRKPQQKGICDQCHDQLVIRSDDKPEAINKRLKTYHKETELLIDYYQQKGIYFKINGMQSIEEVSREIFGVLGIH